MSLGTPPGRNGSLLRPGAYSGGGVDAPPNRVFLADVRGGDQYLRTTWHPDSSTIVFSHWNGEVCLASTPVALTDSTKLIDLMVRGTLRGCRPTAFPLSTAQTAQPDRATPKPASANVGRRH